MFSKYKFSGITESFLDTEDVKNKCQRFLYLYYWKSESNYIDLMKTMKLEKYNSSESASFLSDGGTWHEDVSTKERISWTRPYALKQRLLPATPASEKWHTDACQ